MNKHTKNKFFGIILVFLFFLISGCSQFNKVELGNTLHDKQDAKVILIPMADFHSAILSDIAAQLESAHGFNVATYTAMGSDETMYNSSRKQYVTNRIAENAERVLMENGEKICNKAVIILTNNDINNADFRLRYVFSAHYDNECLSVISTARINPVNYGEPADNQLVMERLLKLINKSIGLHHYKYAISSQKESVMYGPIMSPMDLDAVGSWY